MRCPVVVRLHLPSAGSHISHRLVVPLCKSGSRRLIFKKLDGPGTCLRHILSIWLVGPLCAHLITCSSVLPPDYLLLSFLPIPVSSPIPTFDLLFYHQQLFDIREAGNNCPPPISPHLTSSLIVWFHFSVRLCSHRSRPSV